LAIVQNYLHCTINSNEFEKFSHIYKML